MVQLGVRVDGNVEFPPDHIPVELLKIIPEAHCCNECNYCCLTRAKLFDHWNQKHKSRSSALDQRFHIGAVQTFFKPKPVRYFEVYPSLIQPTSRDAFNVFLADEVPSYPPLPVQIPSHSREIPPLLVSTQWHEHLKEYLPDGVARAALRSLVGPRDITKTRLWDISMTYMKTVSDQARISSFRARCILIEYPR